MSCRGSRFITVLSNLPDPSHCGPWPSPHVFSAKIVQPAYLQWQHSSKRFSPQAGGWFEAGWGAADSKTPVAEIPERYGHQNSPPIFRALSSPLPLLQFLIAVFFFTSSSLVFAFLRCRHVRHSVSLAKCGFPPKERPQLSLLRRRLHQRHTSMERCRGPFSKLVHKTGSAAYQAIGKWPAEAWPPAR